MSKQENYQKTLDILTKEFGDVKKAVKVLKKLEREGLDVRNIGFSSNLAYSECNNCGERSGGY